MSDRYRAASPDTLTIVRLDVLTAIYHRASGETHLVASPAPEILDLLGREEMDAAMLRDRLRAAFDLVDDDAVALDARLDELVAIGLVERR